LIRRRRRTPARTVLIVAIAAAALALVVARSPHQPAGRTADTAVAALRIDDHPYAATPYRREDWSLWLDLDHDGCDTREQALRAASTVPATIGPGCRVVAGHWVSAYDGIETDRPGDEDIDHLVPLETAYVDGAWAWGPDRRAAFANDPNNLWVVSATSNRSKGDRTPDRWRPPLDTTWCLYATRWVAVKDTYQLSATTPERDALVEMLGRCS
jgi:hypothetical protein